MSTYAMADFKKITQDPKKANTFKIFKMYAYDLSPDLNPLRIIKKML